MMDLLSFLGLSYLETYFKSSYTILLVNGAEASVHIEVMVPSSCLVFKNKLSDPNEYNYNAEARPLRRRDKP